MDIINDANNNTINTTSNNEPKSDNITTGSGVKIFYPGAELKELLKTRENFADCQFDGDFTGYDFSNKNFLRANFEGCILRNVNFRGACLNAADLRHTILNGVNMTNTSLKFVDFDYANLPKKHFRYVS